MNFKKLKCNSKQKFNNIKIKFLNRFNKKINLNKLIKKNYKLNKKIKKLVVVIKLIIYNLMMNNFNRI